MEAVESFGREHGADVGRARVAFLSAAHLRRALLEHERLEDVEVLVDGCEGFRDFAQGPPRGGARVVLAAHAVVVPRQDLLLEAGQMRRLLLGGERHPGVSIGPPAAEKGRRRGMMSATTEKRSRFPAIVTHRDARVSD